MTFLNWTILAGLAAVAIPVVIHLLNRRRARRVEWGAMQFLLASAASRNRRIRIEELVLMAVRCLLVALVVLAMARPFVPSRMGLTAAIVLPGALGAALCTAVAGVMWSDRRVRRWLLVGAGVLLVGSVSAAVAERWIQGRRWAAPSGGRDIAIVIDASSSMRLQAGGRSNLDRALDEARVVLAAAGRADAVSLVVAGPSPRAMIASPTSDHRQVADAIVRVEPLDGGADLLDALAVARETLATGGNPDKRIVLITDATDAGWSLADRGRWRFFAENAAAAGESFRLICRTLPGPEGFVNARVDDVRVTPRVVGAGDRAEIVVRVANTGAEPLGPGTVRVSVDGGETGSARLGAIQPNASESVAILHTFERAGFGAISARIDAGGDMSFDDAASHVVQVLEAVDVLVVDGGRDGAAADLTLAMNPYGSSDADGGRGKGLIHAVREPADRFVARQSLDNFDVIVLSDVPALPAASAAMVDRFVRNGGGLLIAPGAEARDGFYNAWASQSGPDVLPGRLAGRVPPGDEPIGLALQSFAHPAMEGFAAAGGWDVGDALVRAYWRMDVEPVARGVRVIGRFDTGGAAIVERTLGDGRVIATAFALDRNDSNLPWLECFVPMVQELARYLAVGAGAGLPIDPGERAMMELRAPRDAGPIAPEQISATVVTPSGERVAGEAMRVGDRLRLSCVRTDEPGLYRFELSEDIRRAYGLGDGGVPFVVEDDPAESRLEPLADVELSRLTRAGLDLQHVRSTEELTAALAGGIPGTEIWAYLALGALMALIAEIALTRWVAVRRRNHRVETVTFGGSGEDVESFRDRARRMLRVPDESNPEPQRK